MKEEQDNAMAVCAQSPPKEMGVVRVFADAPVMQTGVLQLQADNLNDVANQSPSMKLASPTLGTARSASFVKRVRSVRSYDILSVQRIDASAF